MLGEAVGAMFASVLEKASVLELVCVSNVVVLVGVTVT